MDKRVQHQFVHDQPGDVRRIKTSKYEETAERRHGQGYCQRRCRRGGSDRLFF